MSDETFPAKALEDAIADSYSEYERQSRPDVTAEALRDIARPALSPSDTERQKDALRKYGPAALISPSDTEEEA